MTLGISDLLDRAKNLRSQIFGYILAFFCQYSKGYALVAHLIKVLEMTRLLADKSEVGKM
jgi:hypothetical protein